MTLTYDTVPSALLGNEEGVSTTFEFSDGLGSPPVDNLVIIEGQAFGAAFSNGGVDLLPLGPRFIRGDCNSDLSVNIGDGIWILNLLFQGGPTGSCAAACDSNGDDALGAEDAIFVFNYALLDGPLPPAPFPECGEVMNADCDAVCP